MSESKGMTVVEAMKRLRVIEKRIEGTAQDITKYASMVSTQRPLFETEDKQAEEVKRLVQSNMDLLIEYLRLKRRLELTNLKVKVNVSGVEYSISELLQIRRKVADMAVATYSALNDHTGSSALRSGIVGAAAQTPQVVRLYKEEAKNKGLRQWQDLKKEIDSRLEVVNATTALVDDE